MFVRPFEALKSPLRSVRSSSPLATPIEGEWSLWLACRRGLGLGLSRSFNCSFRGGALQAKRNATVPGTRVKYEHKWYYHSAFNSCECEAIRMKLASSVPPRSEKTNRQLEQKHHQITSLLISSYCGDLKMTLHILKRIDRDMDRGLDLGWLEAFNGGGVVFSATLFPRPEIPRFKSHPCQELYGLLQLRLSCTSWDDTDAASCSYLHAGTLLQTWASDIFGQRTWQGSSLEQTVMPRCRIKLLGWLWPWPLKVVSDYSTSPLPSTVAESNLADVHWGKMGFRFWRLV